MQTSICGSNICLSLSFYCSLSPTFNLKMIFFYLGRLMATYGKWEFAFHFVSTVLFVFYFVLLFLLMNVLFVAMWSIIKVKLPNDKLRHAYIKTKYMKLSKFNFCWVISTFCRTHTRIVKYSVVNFIEKLVVPFPKKNAAQQKKNPSKKPN